MGIPQIVSGSATAPLTGRESGKASHFEGTRGARANYHCREPESR
jgi:hypothetical protein